MNLHTNMAVHGFAILCVAVALGVGADQAACGAQHDTVSALQDNHGDVAPRGMVPHWLVETLGRLAAASLLTTGALGLLFRRARWKVLKLHRACAFATIGMGLCHGALALVARLGAG